MLFLVQSIYVYKANFVIISACIVYTGLCGSEVLHASHLILEKHHHHSTLLNFKVLLGYDNFQINN